jgi:transposase
MGRYACSLRRFGERRLNTGCGGCEHGACARAPDRKTGIPTEGTVVTVIVDEHAGRKPVYRQAQNMALQGLPVHRSRLADWG